MKINGIHVYLLKNMTTHSTFADKVRIIVRAIPKGTTMTYKEVAAKAGNPKAARAVGAIMRANYRDDIPCHRVIKTDGSLGHYNRGGAVRKRELLEAESLETARARDARPGTITKVRQ